MTLRRSRPNSAQRWLVLWVAVGILSLVGAAAVSATLSPSNFDALDGNLVVNGTEDDWENIGIDCQSTPKVGCAIDLATGQNDNSFGQGTKEDTAVPTVVSGQIPNNKSDLIRFYVANENVNGTDEFLYLAWERVQEPNGTTNMDFEFNQSETLSANGVTPERTPGDVLIKYDLAQGGVNPVLGYHIWVESGDCEANGAQPPCWDPVHELSGANFEGAINAVAIDDPIPPCDEADDPDCNTLSARTFGEASINLTDAGIFPTGTCTEFGSAYLKSRSSDSFTAALKDFIAPIPVDIANCGSIEIIKDSVPNSTQDFAYTTTGTGLSAFTLDDDGDETDEPATPGDGGDWPNSITFSDVFAGTYTVTETLPVAGWSLTDISCTDPDGGNSSGNVGTATATINVAVSETVTCTFTNKKDATVTITKDAIPDSGQDFGYTTSGAGLSAFTLEDDGDETNEPATPGDGGDWPNTKSFTISGADFGAKTVTETVPSGWSLTGLTCSEGTTNTATGIASFTVDPGDAISCAYTNKKDATVTITKDADPNALTDFSFDVTGTGPAGWVDFDLDDDADVTGGNDTLLNSQTFTFSGNQFGSKTVTETPIPSGWDLGQISCSGDDNYEIGTDSDADFTDGDTKVTLDVDPGETISCTFTNDSLHLVIVLVCHQGTGTLVASDVTLDSDTVTSLSSAPSGLTDAQLCALLDARFEDLEHGEIDLTVDVGSGHLP